jgi:hypothetical protein
MKFDIFKTLILVVLILGAGCGNLSEPNSFSFATQANVPFNTNIQSNVVTIKGNQFGAPIAFTNASSAAYSEEYSINGGTFTAGQSSDLLYPGNTLQLQMMTASTPNTARTATITVGGFVATFTTITNSTGSTATVTDANGNIVTISNISATLSAGTNGVTYTINADTSWTNPTNPGGISGSTIPVAFTLQAVSNNGSGAVYSTSVSQVAIQLGSQGPIGIFSGSLPIKATGNLPNAILIGNISYPITTTNYWSSLVSYWQIAPNSLSIQ